MSGLPGLFSNKKPSFIPEASIQEQDAFLAKGKYFLCEAMNCRMQETSCLKNQQIAVAGTAPGQKVITRNFCVNCKRGRQIAKKHGKKPIALQEKKDRTYIKCGSKYSPFYKNSMCPQCASESSRMKREILEAWS